MQNRLLLGLISILIISFYSCETNSSGKKNEYIEIKGEAQGSTFSIIYNDSLNRYFDKEIGEILTDFDKELSVYLSSSLISKFNKNEIDSINLNETKYFKECILRSIELKKITDTNFSIDVKNIVDYLGFGENKKMLSEIDSFAIDSILNISTDLVITNNILTKVDKRLKLDFNAIAQGYSVDVVASFLETQGVVDYMVEIGGEMRLKGKNSKKENWTIGLETPDSELKNRDFQEILCLSNVSVATSGSYRKFKEINGVKYSHAINPKTGYGVNHNLLSVTVITSNCMDADALATAFLVMGKNKAETFIKTNKEFANNIEAYFIESDSVNYKTSFTEGFNKYIVKN